MGKYELRMLIKQGITPRRTLKGNRSRGPLYEKRYSSCKEHSGREEWASKMTLTTQDQKGRGQDLGFEANKFLVLYRTRKTQIESKRNNFKTLAIRSSSLNWRKGRVPCLSVNQGPERDLVTFDPKGRTHSNPLHLRRNNGGKELEERGNRRFRNKPWHGKEQRR